MTLKGQVAFITGAGRGIGEAIAAAYAAAGAHLVLVARTRDEVERVAREQAKLGVHTLALAADVASHQQVREAVATAVREMGPIDILVNAAGIYGPIGPLVENDLDLWRQTIEINVMGTVYCLNEVLPHMIARRSGVVINLSGGGAVNALPRFSAYATSKAAVVRLTETIAEEVREYNIRVNAVAPGAVNTRLLDQVLEAGERAGKDFYARALQQKETGGTPPGKCAELAVFLASPAAEGLTGRLISAVWDDWASLSERKEELAKSAMYTLRRIDGRNFMESR
jgi:NAD(P)-dependent dehydrogenase (short-subunit alcohol dehydrogenase family)